jgi:hemolysin activation/secretion protein
MTKIFENNKIIKLLIFFLLCNIPLVVQAQSLINLSKIEIIGNTVFPTEELEAIIAPYLNKLLSLEEILNIRTIITEFYVSRGYLNSGAFLPEQDLTDGTLTIQIVEGDLEIIEVNTNQRLQRKLKHRITSPFNINQLETVLERLRRQPTVDSVKATLSPGSASGLSILEVNVQETDLASGIIQINNHNTARFGEWRADLALYHQNFIGIEDRLGLQYGITNGSDSWGVSYSIPINWQDTRLEIGYFRGNSEIISPPFNDLGIRSNSNFFSIGVNHPIEWKLDQELNVGLSLNLQTFKTFLFEDKPFSFSEEAQDGEIKITSLRLTQNWIKRSPTTIFAVNSEFSVGLGILGATVNDNLADSQFLSWQGEFQWLKSLNDERNTIAKLQLATQLTSSDLLSQEQFTLGGIRTIRGYETDIISGDNGLLATGELQFSLLNQDGINLSLIPFIDFGKVWNNTGKSDNNNLMSVGLGLNLAIEDWLQMRINYGVPLIKTVNTTDSLQAEGWNFLLQVKALRF